MVLTCFCSRNFNFVCYLINLFSKLFTEKREKFGKRFWYIFLYIKKIMINLKKKILSKFNLPTTTRQHFEFVWKIQNSKSPVNAAAITSSKKKFKMFTVLSFRRLRFSRYCIRSNRNESQNDLFSKTSKQIFSKEFSTFTPALKTKALGWKKSVATFYYLLIAYKKTIRIKFQYYFNNLTLLQFGIALSPFIAYLIQIS